MPNRCKVSILELYKVGSISSGPENLIISASVEYAKSKDIINTPRTKYIVDLRFTSSESRLLRTIRTGKD